MFLFAWSPLDYGVVSKSREGYVIEKGAYETVEYGARVLSFSARSEHPFRVEVKFWYDGEFYMREMEYEPGDYRIVLDLTTAEGARLLPTRGLGPRPTVITVKSPGEVIVSDVETR